MGVGANTLDTRQVFTCFLVNVGERRGDREREGLKGVQGGGMEKRDDM